jgi:TRAP-type C4-dicarboxylate transport system permease small subunit
VVLERPFLTYILIAAGLLIAAVIRAYLKKRSRLTGFFRFASGVEVTFIALLLFSLIFFGCLQIVLRNFYHRGIIWADPLMRHIVLWLGCLGAAYATSKMRHINIDVFTRFLPKGLLRIRNKIIFLATAIAASILGFAALKLVLDEKSFGEEAFLGVGVWLLQLVLPVAFFLIAYRSLLNLLVPPDDSPAEWDDFAGLEGGNSAAAADHAGGDSSSETPREDGDPNAGTDHAGEDSATETHRTGGGGKEGPAN